MDSPPSDQAAEHVSSAGSQSSTAAAAGKGGHDRGAAGKNGMSGSTWARESLSSLPAKKGGRDGKQAAGGKRAEGSHTDAN